MDHVDESGKTYIGKEFTLPEFREWFAVQNLGAAPYNGVGLHHTHRPTSTQYAGIRTIDGIFNYYRHTLGWPPGKGPHLWLVSPDNPHRPGEPLVAVGTHPRHNGIGISYRNERWLHIEALWDGDAAPFSPEMIQLYRDVLRIVCGRRGYPVTINHGPSRDNPPTWQGVLFHRDAKTNIKSCPGNRNTHALLDEYLEAPVIKPSPRPEPIPVPTEERVMEWKPCRVRKGAVIRQKESLSGSIVYTLPADNSGYVLDGVLKGEVVDGSTDWYVVRTSGRIGVVHESGLVAP